MLGGLRGGIALGLAEDYYLSPSLIGSVGVEGSTGKDYSTFGDNPFILFAGIRHKLGKTAMPVPLFLGVGLLAYCGNNTETGCYLKLSFENFLSNPNMYIEPGIDVMSGYGHATLQCGWYFSPADY